MKIVVNRCYGGFGLSEEAQTKIFKRKGQKLYFYSIAGRSSMRQAMFVSQEEFKKLEKKHGSKSRDLDQYYAWEAVYNLKRDDIDLVAVVEEMGVDKASGDYAKLSIVDIPDNVEWEITEYDGQETVREKHRSW